MRTALVVSADMGLRHRVAVSLKTLRWQVQEFGGGAEALLRLAQGGCEAMLLDGWLPDLEVGEFAAHARMLYPAMEVLRLDGNAAVSVADRNAIEGGGRSPRRNELLHALREARGTGFGGEGPNGVADARVDVAAVEAVDGDRLPELVGSSEAMREVGRLVRMVAGRTTPVLIEGETGTGKEVVARALHRLSRRAAKPLVVLNCAAIPEALLEAELFGHVRGAFTGAVQSRTGRIEMADGGTLLLDEIGEMPLGMQAKMLRFLESGELQRVGENEMVRVDVRLIAATHQALEEQSAEGRFRLDLYHRLAVFPIELPALRERMEDMEELAEHFLERMGREGPRKKGTPEALARLKEHVWPGNVRELMHVLERGVILAGERPVIGAEDIRYRRRPRA
jgi:DNA-binding NtrC family response regulator